MKTAANMLIAGGVGFWTAGFFFGPGSGILWTLGTFAPLAAVLGLFMHLFALVLPNSTAPRIISNRKAEVRKCVTCGRPAVIGSDYCRYHTDEQRYLGSSGGGR
jgi:hypothetical protein